VHCTKNKFIGPIMYKLSIVHVHFVQIITQAKPSYSTHYNVHKSAACTKHK